jgi:hypothetical protein
MPPRKLTAYERLEAIRRRASDLSLLREIWGEIFPEHPENKWFELWLRKYDRDVIAESFEITGAWLRRCDESIEKLKAEGKAVPKELHKNLTDILQYVQGTMKKVAVVPVEAIDTTEDGDDLS